jgi:hypothetical protein
MMKNSCSVTPKWSLRPGGPAGDDSRRDPLVGPVVSHHGGLAQGNVVHVKEDLVGALLVPHPVAGVARVRNDHLDGTLGPSGARAVPVAAAIRGRRTWDAVPGESFGDDVQTGAAEEFGKDPFHCRSVGRLGLQAL